MDPTFHVPTRKQVNNDDQRLRVQTLFNDAHFTVSQIALQTGYTLDKYVALLQIVLLLKNERPDKRFFLILHKERG